MNIVFTNCLLKRKNALALKRQEVTFSLFNKIVFNFFKKLQELGVVESIKSEPKNLIIKFSSNITLVKARRIRYTVSVKDILKYEKRFLFSRNQGALILTTPLGLLTSKERKEKNIGGLVLGYFY
jgi:ribosomal protein S8